MIFYFTGTGNSFAAAVKLQQAFGGELVDMTAAGWEGRYSFDIEKDEKVFFTFPVHFHNLPEIVENFIQKIDFKGVEPEIIGVCTCGASPGASSRGLSKTLEKAGYQLKGFYSVKSPDNYIVYFNTPRPEAQVIINRAASKRMDEIIKSINYSYRLSEKTGPGAILVGWAAGNLKKFTGSTKKFFVTSRCNSCGLCKEVCPEKIIKFENGLPTWNKEECMHCMACICRCPEAAIEYGNRTINRCRVVNPLIKEERRQ